MTYQELSVRVGDVALAPSILALSPAERFAFAQTVSEADDFSELPDATQELIERAEAEIAEAT